MQQTTLHRAKLITKKHMTVCKMIDKFNH